MGRKIDDELKKRDDRLREERKQKKLLEEMEREDATGTEVSTFSVTNKGYSADGAVRRLIFVFYLVD